MPHPRLRLLRRDPGARIGAGPGSLGDEPADGDFVRLLEAASRPSAHRLGIERGASAADPDGTPAQGDRVPGAAARPADAGRMDPAPPGPSGTAWGHTVPGTTRTDPGARARLPASIAAEAPGSPGRPPASRPARPAGRSLRDRIVGIAIAIAVLWTLTVALGRAMDAPDDAFGMLVVLGFVAFLVLRGRLRRRRD